MIRIAIIVGSTRPGRKADAVAAWVHQQASQRNDADCQVVKEWNNKAAGFVAYGSAGGTRAVENLRLVMGELMVADVRAQVALSLFTDFENMAAFKPAESHLKPLGQMLDQLVAWSTALKPLRAG